jgi:hypothetical protein
MEILCNLPREMAMWNFLQRLDISTIWNTSYIQAFVYYQLDGL